MSSSVVVSQVLLWVAVVGLTVLVVALMRQIGLLYDRIAPAGALMGAEEPRVGEHAPVYELRDWRDHPIRVGGIDPDGKRTLLLFTSPSCPVCKELLPVARALRDGEPSLRWIVASDGPRDEHASFVAQHRLESEHYILSEALGRGYQIARLPHAVLLDAEGVVRARGLVNSREHLESLLEADAMGMASIQEYAARQEATPTGRRVA